MEIKEFANMIDGKQYGYPQFTKEELEIAKQNGFVIVYGASDDLMEFDGAVYGECGCYGGGEAWVDRNGVYNCPITVGDMCIKSLWCKEDDITWTYKTDIPHETFMIYEDDEAYCRGIVFSINDLN